jgi:hypothetical protein
MTKQEVVTYPKQNLWAQGCLLKATSLKASSIVPTSNDGTSLNGQVEQEAFDDEFFVVISHTCDIQKASNKEPYIEIMRVFRTSDGKYKNNNSIRYHVLKYEKPNKKGSALVADATIRLQIKKDDLLPLTPIICIPETDTFRIHRFREWLTKRYDRQAIPDDIVENIQKPIVDAVKQLEKQYDKAAKEGKPIDVSPPLKALRDIWRIQYFTSTDVLPYQVEMIFIRDEREDITPIEEEAEEDNVSKLADWINGIFENSGNKAELNEWELVGTKDINLYDFLHSYDLPLDDYTLSDE